MGRGRARARYRAGAVGGGGLIAGIAAWYGRRVKVVGVEPEGSRALHASLEAGRPVDVTVESIAADSLGARNTGQLVYDIARADVDHVALVPDDAIVAAQRALWGRARLRARFQFRQWRARRARPR